MTNDASKQVPKDESTKAARLFEPFLDSEQVAERISSKSPQHLAHQVAMGLLLLDSDKLTQELEAKGPEYYENIARYMTAGMELWAHDMKLMVLAVERARVIAALATERKETDSLN